MIFNKYFDRKLIACLLYTFFTTLISMLPIQSSVASAQIHFITDDAFNKSLGIFEGYTNEFASESIEAGIKSEKTKLLSDNIEQYIKNMNNNTKQYYQEIDKWQKLTEPNLNYPNLIEKLNTDLIAEDASTNTELALLKQGLFSNAAALLNTAAQYSQNNSTYATAIRDKSMCPNPATKLITTPNNDSYGKLHQDSCLVIYNLRAYKTFFNTEIRKKHDLIDKTTKKIFALPDITMGDHNARKDALMSVQILREKMIYEHKINMEEIDTRIKVADRTRVYSGSAMVGGAPTNPGTKVAAEAAKTALALSLTGSIPKTPYNQ